jgi:integrase
VRFIASWNRLRKDAGFSRLNPNTWRQTGKYWAGDLRRDMAVYQRRGAWWIDYYYQDRRHRQKIGSRKKDAEEALSRIKVQIAAGEFVPPDERKRSDRQRRDSMLFRDFAEKEFLPWSETEHAASHHQRLRSIFNAHLVPFFGDYRLDEITSRLVASYKTTRRRAVYTKGEGKRKRVHPVNAATVNRELCALKVMFKKAVEWDYIENNPTLSVKVSKETPKEVRLLEGDEIVRLIECLPDHLKALVACAVYAGLRRSELFHLRWSDIYWKTGEIAVVSRQEHHTKNYTTRRIPMNDALQEMLRRHPHRLGSPYVFCNAQGEPYDNVRKALLTAATAAGIDGRVTLHPLRHAFCSHALMQGIDPRTVQKWMGHQDLKTTLKYAHVSPAHEREAIQRLRYDQIDRSFVEKTG